MVAQHSIQPEWIADAENIGRSVAIETNPDVEIDLLVVVDAITTTGIDQLATAVISRTRFSFGFFQFPVVAHTCKNWGKREDDQPDNAQAENDSEE